MILCTILPQLHHAHTHFVATTSLYVVATIVESLNLSRTTIDDSSATAQHGSGTVLSNVCKKAWICACRVAPMKPGIGNRQWPKQKFGSYVAGEITVWPG